jgi:WD40 repeat protein/tetratricopeptide (TPR) repeat protein
MSGDGQSNILLGPDNPWPGLNQFFEDHDRYFRGRDEEKAELFRLVKSETLTILFGKSGLGKSSLLQAGLFPVLRQAGYLPVYIHIRHEDPATDAPPLVSQVYSALREACTASKVEAPEIRDEEALWAYFHRAGAAFWNERNRLVTPVLVLDQFEEAFTLGVENDRRRTRRDDFLAQLEELIENRPPQTLRERWNKDPELVSDFEQGRTPCKIILSLREDFLPDLEQLKERIRSIMQNRFRLERMDGCKAWQVVTGETMIDGEPRRALSHLVDEGVALKIIDFVSRMRGQRNEVTLTRETLRARTVDPALLSVVCSELNNRRRAQNPSQDKISFTLLSDSKEEIIREFFNSHVNGLGPGAGPVRRFIEEELITGSGFRKRCDLDDALRQQGVTKDDLSRLEQHRILRFEPSEGITWIELTHDLLTEVVSTGRRQRREREERAKADAVAAEERKKRKKKKVLMYSAFALLALVALSTLLLLQEMRRRGEASRLVTQMHLGRAERMLEKDDPAGAFLLFDQALGTDPDKESTARHRLRLGVAWRQMPRLKELLHFERLSRAELAPGGGFIAANGPSGVRIWRLDPGKQPQSRDLITGRKVSWASFHPDPQKLLLVTAAGAPDETEQALGAKRQRGEVAVWNVETGKPEGTLRSLDEGTARKAWFSPDGSDRVLVVSDLDDGKKSRVEIWNFQTGTMEAEPLLNEWPVNWAAFSRDGRFVVIAAGESQDGTEGHAVVWDWRDGRTTLLQREGGPVVYAEFNEDGTKVLTADGIREGALGGACLWSYPNAAPNTRDAWHSGVLLALFSHEGAATRAHFSPDGRWIATASRDSTVRLWHVGTQKEVLKIKHDGDVNDVAFSPDGRYLVSGGRDRGARIWEVATGQLLGSPFWHSETVVEVAFSPDGRTILTSSKHLARIWDVGLNEPKAAQLKVGGSVALAAVSADGARLVTISDKDNRDRRSVKLWQTASGRCLAALPLEGVGRVPCVAINADGSSVAVASYDPDTQAFSLQIYKAEAAANDSEVGGRFEPVGSFKSHLGEVAFMTFSADGRSLCTISRQTLGEPAQEILLWDIAAAEPLDTSPGKQDLPMNRAQFSPRGTYLLAIGSNPASKISEGLLWNLSAPASNRQPDILRHDEAITSAMFSADERRILTGSRDDRAKVWELAVNKITSSRVLVPNKTSDDTHTADLTSTRFSPDGKSALTTSKDQTAILWNLQSFEPIATLRHPAKVNEGVFSADGSLVLTVSAEPKLRVWSAVNGDLLAILNFAGETLKAGFSADGGSIFAVCQNVEKRARLAARRGAVTKKLAPADCFVPEVMPLVLDLRLLRWSIAPLDLEPKRISKFGQLLAARSLRGRKMDAVTADELRNLWNEHGKDYAVMSGPDPDSEHFHQAAADRCEATQQWFAAAWHLSRLHGSISDPPDVNLLLRRARAYAAAEDWARSIADYKAAVTRKVDQALYCEIARTCVEYAKALDPSQWDAAIEAYGKAATLDPHNVWTSIHLGEIFAAKRDFTQARAQFNEPLRVAEHGAAKWRLAVAGWLSGTDKGKAEYRSICRSAGNAETSLAVASLLVWPSVLTPEFEGEAAFCARLVALAQASVDANRSDFEKLNTLGAALYRSKRYQEALLKLEEARSAFIADRATKLGSSYDRLIRIPISPAIEGRPLDWVFMSMAYAQLGNAEEAEKWMKKLRDAPELSHLKRPLEQRPPASWSTLCLELLYDEADALLRYQRSSKFDPLTVVEN